MSEVVLSAQAERIKLQPRQSFVQRYKNNLIVAGVIVGFLFLFVLTNSNTPQASRRATTGGAAQGADKSLSDSDNGKYGPYVRKLQARIKHCWLPPRGNSSSHVLVSFSVNPDGSLGKNVRIIESSGSKQLDRAAIEACVKAAPFAPLPEGLEQPVNIKFKFDYNVHN